MPPVHDQGNASSAVDLGILLILSGIIVLTVALGLVTCVLSHFSSGVGDGDTPPNPHHQPSQAPTSAHMLSVVSAGAAAGVGGMDRLRGGRATSRELAASRDRQVRLHTVHTDLAINLPPSIALPDGEDHPFNSRLHLRDKEQESELLQKCIRPPPNRTALESESPPPYRSSSATGLLGTYSYHHNSTNTTYTNPISYTHSPLASLSSSSSCGPKSSGSFYGGGSGGGCGSAPSTTSTYEWSTSSAGGGCGSANCCGIGGGSASLVMRCHTLSTSATSTKHRPETTAVTGSGGGSGGQKTDFLQRTVKIFTGGGKKTGTLGASSSSSSTTTTHTHQHHAVMVPTTKATARRIPNDHPQTSLNTTTTTTSSSSSISSSSNSNNCSTNQSRSNPNNV